ncbi:undecaprenyl/decaprenyl-phosphate alpha-N-acetylglucosaminyl 1-phosphate transferase [Candidatus Daviesbacteria bacterium]|nr:undecaprenyl/decaprenyl-phosphate alpha-N-acetylglucosaminyl 1-phosphate transferase [Candidatus Daviesbacteria bacterium]
MDKVILPFLISLLITIVSTPLAIIFAKKYKLVDNPRVRPHPAHVQKRIIPRAGGLPIYIGLIISILLFIPMDKHILGIILAATLLLVIGLIDDVLKNFSPYPRLLMQIIAAGIIVISGTGITFVTNPFGGILRLDQFVFPVEFFGTHNIILLADLLAFIWIVWMMNMINWSKGVDGQMAGIVAVAALTIGFLSIKLFNQGDPNQLAIALLAFITSGVSLGFLIFNWFPSKIMPAFSGSSILGLMIAVLSILSGAKLATALLVMLIPSVDFLYTFFRRIASGKSPFLGDQQHLHHLLLKAGWSHQRISLFYISSCAILGLLATSLSTEGKLFIALAVGVIILGTILWLNSFGHSFEQSDQDNG